VSSPSDPVFCDHCVRLLEYSMSFDITPTAAQHDLARRTHEFAVKCVRPVALEYDQRQEFPWPVLEEAAARGFYSPLFCRDLIGDPTACRCRCS
jgi:acyl-CoA dehydrogenase